MVRLRRPETWDEYRRLRRRYLMGLEMAPPFRPARPLVLSRPALGLELTGLLEAVIATKEPPTAAPRFRTRKAQATRRPGKTSVLPRKDKRSTS